jgi:acetylornithine/succinyldiaminopimelate/putrescine aminotransferase
MPHSYYPGDVLPEGFRIARAANDLLFTEDGERYIDLFSGCGTAFLGHVNPAISLKIRGQLDRVWITGAVPTRIGIEAQEEIESFFPRSHRVAGLYSTGMEAAEFALRVSRHFTGRKGVVGFEGCMHGKSLATARLGWPNELVTLPDFQLLPYLPNAGEEQILEQLENALSARSVAAVFLEPLLGSSGGHCVPRSLLQGVASLCVQKGSLLVLDEIFTGFHRTGQAFLHQELGVTPDVVLIGKGIGSGFPVSGVVADRRLTIDGRMLPGSTYAGNPLAAAAVAATLQELKAMRPSEKVAAIEKIVVASLGVLAETGIALRGKGALWVLELPAAIPVSGVVARIVRRGVIVSPTGAYVRLLPAATIETAHLAEACEVVRDVCQRAAG